jgi:ABC-type phosphonate transport system ATPase subunit
MSSTLIHSVVISCFRPACFAWSLDELRGEIIPRAEAFGSEGGPRYLAISARFLGDFMAYAEEWLARLEAQLEAEQ